LDLGRRVVDENLLVLSFSRFMWFLKRFAMASFKGVASSVCCEIVRWGGLWDCLGGYVFFEACGV